MDNFPKSLTITDGGMLNDGGTIVLLGSDETGSKCGFCIDWSLDRQDNGTTVFTVNRIEIPKGSDTEKEWLDLLRNATVQVEDEITRFFNAQQMTDMLHSSIEELIFKVLSKTHQSWHSIPENRATEE